MSVGSSYYTSRYGYGTSSPFDPFRFTSVSFAIDPPKPATPKPVEPTFKSGDRVAVKIDTTATVDYVYSNGEVDLTLADGTELSEVAPKFVTLRDPENWPPKPGQAWKASGKLFGIRQNYAYLNEVVAYPIGLEGKSYSKGNGAGRTLDDFKALRPVKLA